MKRAITIALWPNGIWVGGRKSKNDSANKFPKRAENQSAENTIAPKRYSPISIVIVD